MWHSMIDKLFPWELETTGSCGFLWRWKDCGQEMGAMSKGVMLSQRRMQPILMNIWFGAT